VKEVKIKIKSGALPLDPKKLAERIAKGARELVSKIPKKRPK